MTMAATKPGYLLALATTPSVSIGPQQPKDGVPVQRFRKELIRVGQFVKQSEGLAFEVDQRTLDHWAATFSKMRSNGIKVPIPAGHDKAGDPESNHGWVQEMFVEGDRLIGVLELVGEDALKLAKTNDVSIYTPPEYDDTLKNHYQWPILHVSLAPDPVIPGLADFIPIAASQGQTPVQVPVLRLQETPMTQVPTDAGSQSAPSGGPDPLKEAFRTKIMQAVDDDSLDMKATLARIKEILTAQEKILGLVSDKPAPTEPAAEGSVAASQGDSQPDPTLLKLAAENYDMKLNSLVSQGRITPKVRDTLQAQLIGPENKVLSLALSAGSTAHIDATIAALAENDPVELREMTAGQTLALHNPAKGAEPLSKETQAYMEQAAGVKQPA